MSFPLSRPTVDLDSPQVPHPQAPFTSTFVPVLASSSPASASPPIDELRARAEAALKVFDEPRYAHLDVPGWAHRAAAYGAFQHHKFTVRNLIRVMRDTAADLGLAEGERYVLAAVCACADEAAAAADSGCSQSLEPEAQGAGEAHWQALARGLQRLANAWTAFLLWSFYAPMKDDENMATGFASPCVGLAFAPKAMAAGYVDPGADSGVCADSYPLQQQVLRRDGYKCVMSDVWDTRYWTRMRGMLPPHELQVFRDGAHAWTDAVRIFKHPLVVYKDVYDNDEPKRASTLLSLELLRRYCQVSDKYIGDRTGSGVTVMDAAENLITLNMTSHSKFDHFALCLVPTQDHAPRATGLPFPSMTLPDTITFRDHSNAVDNDASGPAALALPSRELLRMHAALGSVLHTSGVVELFDRILYTHHSSGRPRDGVGESLPLPTPDGVAFWRDVVDEDQDVLDRLVRSFAPAM